MQITLTPIIGPTVTGANDWLRKRFIARHISVHVYEGRLDDDGYFHVPVYVSGKFGTYESAKLLAALQSMWNRRLAKGENRLFLVLGAKPTHPNGHEHKNGNGRVVHSKPGEIVRPKTRQILGHLKV